MADYFWHGTDDGDIENLDNYSTTITGITVPASLPTWGDTVSDHGDGITYVPGTGVSNANWTYSNIIDGGTFNGQVDSGGTINGGTFTNSFNNYGAVTGGTFTSTTLNNGTVNGGTFGSFENANSVYAGTFTDYVYNGSILYGGTFNGGVDNYGSIWGGTFTNDVTNYFSLDSGTFNGYVNNQSYINDGTFNDVVDNNYDIYGGDFASDVNNYSNISGGNFTGDVYNHNNISGGTFLPINWFSNESGASIYGGTFYSFLNPYINHGFINNGTWYGIVENNGIIDGSTATFERVKLFSGSIINSYVFCHNILLDSGADYYPSTSQYVSQGYDIQSGYNNFGNSGNLERYPSVAATVNSTETIDVWIYCADANVSLRYMGKGRSTNTIDYIAGVLVWGGDNTEGGRVFRFTNMLKGALYQIETSNGRKKMITLPIEPDAPLVATYEI